MAMSTIASVATSTAMPLKKEQLSEIDKMLLGEVEIANGEGRTIKVAKGGPYDPEQYHFNGTMGTLIVVDKKGDPLKIEGDEELNDADISEAKVVPAKRRNDHASQASDSTIPAKKRNTAKNVDKGSAAPKTPTHRKKASIKSTSTENEGDNALDEPVTPPNKRATSTKAAPGKYKYNGRDDEEGDEDPLTPPKSIRVEGTNARGTPRKRQPPKDKTAVPRGIPESWEEADEADRMLCRMKQQDPPASWDEIRKAWKQITGVDSAASTLPNRWNRIKCNMMRFKPGDAFKLVQAVKKVEANLEKEKWNLIAREMIDDGAEDNYPTAFLQKKYKEYTDKSKNGTVNSSWLIGAMESGELAEGVGEGSEDGVKGEEDMGV